MAARGRARPRAAAAAAEGFPTRAQAERYEAQDAAAAAATRLGCTLVLFAFVAALLCVRLAVDGGAESVSTFLIFLPAFVAGAAVWCVVCVFVCGVREDPDEGPGGAARRRPFGRGAHGGGGGARVAATPEELELAAMLQGLQAAAAAEQARQAQWQSPAAAAGAAGSAPTERMRAEQSMANLSDDERREAMEQLAAVAVLGGLLAGATLGLAAEQAAAEQHVQQQQPGAAPPGASRPPPTRWHVAPPRTS